MSQNRLLFATIRFMELNELLKLSLLYVEDDELVSKSYATSFELFFQNVYIAKNYEEALDIYAKNSPDIVLVDIYPPHS